MHGFIKFPNGFPAAPITLTYRSYPEIARGFLPRRDFKPAKYIPPEERAGKRADDGGEGGRENTPTRPEVAAVADEKGQIQPAAPGPSTERSEAEIAASAMNVPVQPASSLPAPSTEPRSAAQDNPFLARTDEGSIGPGGGKVSRPAGERVTSAELGTWARAGDRADDSTDRPENRRGNNEGGDRGEPPRRSDPSRDARGCRHRCRPPSRSPSSRPISRARHRCRQRYGHMSHAVSGLCQISVRRRELLREGRLLHRRAFVPKQAPGEA